MIAYEKARKSLRGILPLNAAYASDAVWMVLGVALSFARRAGRDCAVFGDAPAWQDLSVAERNALAACWRMVGPERQPANEVSRDYPFLAQQWQALGWAIDQMERAPDGLRLSRRRLRQSGMRQAQYSCAANAGQGDRPLHAQIAYVMDLAAALEARFGVQRPAMPDPCGFALSVLEADETWLAANRDPDFWHVLLPTLVELCFVANFARQVLPVLDWMLAQPDCDQATAAAAFVLLDGPRLAPVEPGCVTGWEQEQLRQVLCQSITERAESGLYEGRRLLPSTLGLPDDLSARAGGAALPVALFGSPFTGREPETPYYVENGTIHLAMV